MVILIPFPLLPLSNDNHKILSVKIRLPYLIFTGIGQSDNQQTQQLTK